MRIEQMGRIPTTPLPLHGLRDDIPMTALPLHGPHTGEAAERHTHTLHGLHKMRSELSGTPKHRCSEPCADSQAQGSAKQAPPRPPHCEV